MHSNRFVVHSVATAALLLVATAARGGKLPIVLVEPGGFGVVEPDYAIRIPPGVKIAEKIIPYAVEFEVGPDELLLSQDTAIGTLTSSVYRTEGAGTLSFLYVVDLEPIVLNAAAPNNREAPVSEENRLRVGSFAGFLTAVAGDLGSSFGVKRSADGASLTADIGSDGLGKVPIIFVVLTDATAFDDRGLARFEPGHELLVRFRDNDPNYEYVSGVVDIGGIFQPVVPEPSSALPAVAAAAVLMRRRRRIK